MTTSHLIPLDAIIPGVLSTHPSERHVRDFVYVCRNLAVSYLQTKISAGKLDLRYFGVSVEDLALDCIAPLFERDSKCRYVELKEYYARFAWTRMSAEELLSTTRILIFSMVNEELFRNYHEHDPSLSRLIRNIKIALKSSQALVPIVRGNETWIQLLSSNHRSEVLPILPPEIVEARLLAHVRQRHDFRHILEFFAEILREQDLYQKQYPLVGTAVIIRSMMAKSSWLSETASEEHEDISKEEIGDFIESSIKKTRSAVCATYVGRGKLSEEMFGMYFDCIDEILRTEYIADDGVNLSFFDAIRRRIPSLNYGEYRKHHRVYLEYLAKLTRVKFLESVKREYLSQS